MDVLEIQDPHPGNAETVCLDCLQDDSPAHPAPQPVLPYLPLKPIHTPGRSPALAAFLLGISAAACLLAPCIVTLLNIPVSKTAQTLLSVCFWGPGMTGVGVALLASALARFDPHARPLAYTGRFLALAALPVFAYLKTLTDEAWSINIPFLMACLITFIPAIFILILAIDAFCEDLRISRSRT